jgi:hypothetical protein
MSASTIIDSLCEMLNAASAFGGNAAKHFGVLESSSGSCCVIQYMSINDTEETFGTHLTGANWTFSVKGYSKDLGNPEQTLDRVIGITDTFLAVIRADRTLQGTVNRINQIRGSRELPPNGAVEAGGATWLEVPFEIDCLEWPDG